MINTPAVPSAEEEKLRKEDIDSAFNKWLNTPDKLSSLSTVYYALRAVLGRAENPASFPANHPLVAYAENKLVAVTRGVTGMSKDELEVDAVLLLHIILHNKRWKCFLNSDSDKRLLAAQFCSYVPDAEPRIYQGICDAITEWSGVTFNPDIKNWETPTMEKFFGIGWTHLYMDEVKGNARAKFNTLGSVMAPIIFEQSNPQRASTLPSDLSSFT